MDNREHIRDLAKRYMEIATSDQQKQTAELWRSNNSLRKTRPLFFTLTIPYDEFFDFSTIRYEDEPLRSIEIMLATSVHYRVKLKDDFVFNPWVTVNAVLSHPMQDRWGVPCILGEKPRPGGAAAFDPHIIDEKDLNKLRSSPYIVDEAKTHENVETVYDVLGDIIGIYVNKRGLYARDWNMDISTDLARIIGFENLILSVYENPEFLHSIASFMRDTILTDIHAVEDAGNNCLADSMSQIIPFVDELPDPDCNVTGCPTSKTWGFFAAQEFTMMSPKHFYEFILQYQMPIIELFGLTAYGCCEDLTDKIDLMKKIKNLRRISVSPFADTEKCAQQIGNKYVISWRPNPATMVSFGLDEDYVRKDMRKNFAHFKRNNCIFDITLKELETINRSPENLIRWSEIVREEVENYYTDKEVV